MVSRYSIGLHTSSQVMLESETCRQLFCSSEYYRVLYANEECNLKWVVRPVGMIMPQVTCQRIVAFKPLTSLITTNPPKQGCMHTC